MKNQNYKSNNNKKPSLEELCEELKTFIISESRKFKSLNGSDYDDDLLQEGMLAICENYSAYDPMLGRPTTFFRPHILHRMQEYVNRSVFNTTGHYSKSMKKIARAKDKLREFGILYPTAEQIYIETNGTVSLVTIRACQDIEIHNKSISINDTENFTDDFYKNQSLTTVSPETICIKKTEANGLVNSISRLSEEEKKCIKLKYGFETGKTKSYREVGDILNLTPDKIRRILNTATSKLKEDADIKHIYKTELKNQQKIQHQKEIGFGSAKTAMPIIDAIDNMIENNEQLKNAKDVNSKKRKKQSQKNKNKDNDFFL